MSDTDTYLDPCDFAGAHGLDGLRARLAADDAAATSLDEYLGEQPDGTPPSDDGHRDRRSQASRLVDIATDANVEPWHDVDRTPYLTIDIDGHREHWPARSNAVRELLSMLAWRHAGVAPSASATTDAVTTLAAHALYDGPEHPTAVRVGGHCGRVYVDLSDAEWRVVEVDQAGWRIVTDPPVRMIRRPGMQALPAPRRGGSLDDLWKLLRIRPEDRPIVAGWLLASLRARGPFPALDLGGEQGSGKSTIARMLRRLIDPSMADLRSPPREERDLVVAARSGWVVTADNISTMPQWLSDGYCRIATGGGYSARTLYSDADETIVSVTRPILLTAIEGAAGAGDLVDRAHVVNCPAIPRSERIPESDLWTLYEELRPGIFGVLLDGVSQALRRWDTVTLDELPRMADAARWVTAGESAMGIPEGSYVEADHRSRADGVALAVEGDPVAAALESLAETSGPGGWTGTTTELLGQLTGIAGERIAKTRAWPKTPRKLGGLLRRVMPDLRAAGVWVEIRLPDDRGRPRLVQVAEAGAQRGERGDVGRPTE